MIVVLLVFCVYLPASTVFANAPTTPEKEEKTAIIIASFGTTVPEALPAIINIVNLVKKTYPKTEVRLSFTSNIIRKVWRSRQNDPQKWLDQGIPKDVLYPENIISVFGDLRDEGYKNIIVQPTHMFFMEQSYDLSQYVNAMAAIKTKKDEWKPFNKIVMGLPALGKDGANHLAYVKKACSVLGDDVALAKKNGASLVYMGHGNHHWQSSIYVDVQKEMKRQYPQVTTIVGVVEGQPDLEQIIAQLEKTKNKKVFLKPFMIVAGDHANNDMAGPEEDSWKTILESKGFEVSYKLEGLGQNSGFANIFIDHIADVASKNNILLK